MPDPDLPPPLPAGFLPGRYGDVRPLGLGGMAAVYEAYDTRVGRSVVVKVLDEGRIGPSELEECRRRFVTEARAAAAIHHPNVIGPDANCFGEGARPNGVARFTLRPGEPPRETDFVQCGRPGDPEAADGVYRFAAPTLPASARVVAVEGFFGIEPNSRDDHEGATVEWVVSYAGRELCAPRVGPGALTDERIGALACRVGAPRGVPADAGTLEITQRVTDATPSVRFYAGVVAPTLVVRRPVS